MSVREGLGEQHGAVSGWRVGGLALALALVLGGVLNCLLACLLGAYGAKWRHQPKVALPQLFCANPSASILISHASPNPPTLTAETVVSVGTALPGALQAITPRM